MLFAQEAKAIVWFIDDTLKPVGVLTAAGLDVGSLFSLYSWLLFQFAHPSLWFSSLILYPWHFRDISVFQALLELYVSSTCPSRHRTYYLPPPNQPFVKKKLTRPFKKKKMKIRTTQENSLHFIVNTFSDPQDGQSFSTRTLRKRKGTTNIQKIL